MFFIPYFRNIIMTSLSDVQVRVLRKKRELEEKLIDFFTKILDVQDKKSVPSAYFRTLDTILKYLNYH